jgi:arginine decarboxylase
VALMDPKIDERLKSGPELVSANFVIPYPPGFPIMVPGQVIEADTIGYMRKLDVKEIHGYNNERGLKLIKLSAIPPSNGKGAAARGAAKQSDSQRKTAPSAQSKSKAAASK